MLKPSSNNFPQCNPIALNDKAGGIYLSLISYTMWVSIVVIWSIDCHNCSTIVIKSASSAGMGGCFQVLVPLGPFPGPPPPIPQSTDDW